MSIRNLDHLFSPKSVALVGASNKPGGIGRVIANNLTNGGFNGPIWFANPGHTDIGGKACFASVRDLPDVPDLAVIATPPATIPGLIADLAVKGTRAAVVITAGISGAIRQAMLDAARPSLLRIQGANCLGLMLPTIGLNASFCHRMPQTGSLALVSQSGALITGVIDWAAGRGIGFSHVVSLGDMADVDFGDVLDYLADDASSRAILIYMEHVTHAPKFMSAARRAARVKPVIVLKAGRHAAGAKAALSHTGALSGSDGAYDAAFRRAGLLRVSELEDLFSAAEILSHPPRLNGERLMILTNGGGAGVLAADRLADLDGHLAEISVPLREALDASLPPTWSRNNPIDIIGDADAARYVEAFTRIVHDPASDAVLVMNCPTALESSLEIANALIGAGTPHSASARSTKPILTTWLGDEAAHAARDAFAKAHIPTFDTPASAIEGFMHLVQYRRAQDELMAVPPISPENHQGDDLGRVATIIDAVLAEGREMLTEHEAKSVLAACGIPIAATETASTPHEVAVFAGAILKSHAACVVKLLSRDIIHKSDVGGVRLNLESTESARRAAVEIVAAMTRLRPEARIDGFTVQPMVRRPNAHELIVGMSVDATFGPMLMFGAGGVAVEVLRDSANALPPLDLKLARDVMRQTRIYKLLEGYRDRPAADLDAIAMTLARVSGLIIAHPEIRELDINPLLADQNGVVALDARIRVSRGERVPLAIRPYPSEWESRIELAAVGVVMLRPIRPSDEHLYAAFIERLTPNDLRMRFFIARPAMDHKMIARLTQIDYAREMAFVALNGTNGQLIGVARLYADPDYRRAEFAVTVASDLKGKGLGWQLMQRLIDYARKERIASIFGHVLSENVTMLQMCRELGFSVIGDLDDPSLSVVELKFL
jgi:acetyltransferase